ncbi:MAG: bifunctional homocysteine S-methyltransferase/methylenetetrahydrofolate reductase, partial [Syntrophomonas sp.]|nr:bifunctional homocysteine S-methyltransferase/methylenetetrahydrofolate reductase [Syntrophomonas sp.]
PLPGEDDGERWEDYRQIVDLFLARGASNFLFETFSSEEYLVQLSQYIKEHNPNAFVIVSFAVSPEGLTRLGKSGGQLLEDVLREPCIDAGGFNCYSGPSHLLEYIKTLSLADKTISIMPNSGYPALINNRTFFQNTKEYFASQMLEIARQGVTILGGCCGTTPDYIREMAARLASFSPLQLTSAEPYPVRTLQRDLLPNPLLEKMTSGHKIIAVELDPPIDTDIAFFLESARTLKEQGVDAITIADSPLARARVDSSIMACKLKRELGITPIPHLTCRDRNINATKALLLGLNVEGVNNVLVVTGDPVPTAQRDEVKGVFSFNSAVLARYISNFNQTAFASPFNICAALNLNARNFSHELQRAAKKIDNGVAMFLTQPVLSPEAVDNLASARRELPARILGGIMPIVSYKNACFMNNEIAGIRVAPEIVELYRDLSKEEATAQAVAISVRFAREIFPYVDGYYLITPFKRIDLVSAIIARLRALER